LIETQTVFTD